MALDLLRSELVMFRTRVVHGFEVQYELGADLREEAQIPDAASQTFFDALSMIFYQTSKMMPEQDNVQRDMKESLLAVPCSCFARTRTFRSEAKAKASTQVVTHLPVGCICNQVVQSQQAILSRSARRSEAQVRSSWECRCLILY